jgi:hypothetical protein
MHVGVVFIWIGAALGHAPWVLHICLLRVPVSYKLRQEVKPPHGDTCLSPERCEQHAYRGRLNLLILRMSLAVALLCLSQFAFRHVKIKRKLREGTSQIA